MKIAEREKMVLMGGGAFVALFVFITAVLVPLSAKRTVLETEITLKDSQLRQVYVLAEKIRTVEQMACDTRGKGKEDVTLFGVFERIALDTGIKENIEYMKPIESSAPGLQGALEVKIRGIGTQALTQILYTIETSPYSMRVGRINIRRIHAEETLTVTMQVGLYG